MLFTLTTLTKILQLALYLFCVTSFGYANSILHIQLIFKILIFLHVLEVKPIKTI